MQRHRYCKNPDCNVCLEDFDTLQEELKARCGGNADFLGKYRTFMDKRLGKTSETEWGWAIPEVFEQANIDAFVKENHQQTGG